MIGSNPGAMTMAPMTMCSVSDQSPAAATTPEKNIAMM